MKRVLLIVIGLFVGLGLGFLAYRVLISGKQTEKAAVSQTPVPKSSKPVIIGFLPFWLINKATSDYSFLTDFTYFSLVVDSDGSIQKYTKPTEGEPGYFGLINGKADKLLNYAAKNNMNLSLAVFNGDDKDITEMLNDPQASANNLVNDVVPIMQKYHFSDLNFDIEQVSDASPEARLNFSMFARGVKNGLVQNNAGKMTIDVVASSFVKDTTLADPKSLAEFADALVIMGYDYHHSGSMVTGPVAPVNGVETIAEFDVETAILKALEFLPPEKIILGIPLYGYEWESPADTPRSPVIPGTGLILSNSRAEEVIKDCTNCITQYSETDQEEHTIYKDPTLNVYHQLFYPTAKSTQAKIDLVTKYHLGGIAVWALGYEGGTILRPLAEWNR